MKAVKGTRTYTNLMKAFAGETQAHMRYTYFAAVARKEGFKQVEYIFQETADQESQHAKRLFRFMGTPGEEIEITSSFPAGPERDTHQNLLDAAAGEHHEYSEMYPDFAKIADEEGFPEIAAVMRAIANAEKFHEERYLGLAKNIAEGKVFKRDTKVSWRCRNCGYVCESSEAPKTCPACDHPQAHFELLCVNW